jgi:hypothetical protein
VATRRRVPRVAVPLALPLARLVVAIAGGLEPHLETVVRDRLGEIAMIEIDRRARR